MLEIRTGDIIKLKKESGYPWYTHLVIWTIETWEIKIVNLTRSFLEEPTKIEIELFWWRQINYSYISKKAVEKILLNIYLLKNNEKDYMH